ncbi:esterase-like activity of phytase family protein [soil metagenome]
MNIRMTFALGHIAAAALLATAQLGAQAASLDYLGQQVVATGATYLGTQVGGLSGIDFDAGTGRYVAISDDRSALNPARYYDLALDLSKFNRSNTPGNTGVQFTGVTTLLTPAGTAYPNNGVDPESIRLRHTAAGTTVLWTNEGLRSGATYQAPTLREATTAGAYVRDFAVPSYYLPSGSAGATAPGDSGIRNNLAFESLTLSADGKHAYIATENALAQDGPKTSLTTGSPSRVAEFDLATGERTAEFIYRTEPIASAPTPANGSADSGLVEMLAVGDHRFIAVERSFAQGVGFGIRLFLTDTTGATDVFGLNSILGTNVTAMQKTLLLDLGTLRNDDGSALVLDNIEGITFGADVNGHRTLVLVSDNNFSSGEFTQFVALQINGDLMTAAVPEPETYALMLAGLAAVGFAARRRKG